MVTVNFLPPWQLGVADVRPALALAYTHHPTASVIDISRALGAGAGAGATERVFHRISK